MIGTPQKTGGMCVDEVLYAPRNRMSPVVLPGFAPEGPEMNDAPGQRAARALLFVQSLCVLAMDLMQVGAIKVGRQVDRRYHTIEAAASRYKPGRLEYLLIVSGICLMLIVSSLFQMSLQVSIDGKTIGLVDNEAAFLSAMDSVEEKASQVLGYSYDFTPRVSYCFTFASRGSIMSESAIQTALFDQIGEVTKAYVLTVGGTPVGASQSRTELEQILDGLLAKYRSENTIKASFAQDVSVKYEYASMDVTQDLDDIRTKLAGNEVGQVTYTAQDGDTLSGIAVSHGMSLSQLTAMNPGITPEKLQIGQKLVVSQPIPKLAVQTVDKVSYVQAVGYDVQKVDDASMYQGQTKVIRQGVNGQARVTANVNKINGVEQSRDVLSSAVIAQPVTQVVAVGTKEKPKTAPTGSFAWPVSGPISSGFGYRSLLGTYRIHEGIDIRGSYGAPIKAADGGTVVFAGWQGDYGYLVIVDHGNGLQTYYGHNSRLLVSAGDKVYKGQKIARMGSTGRSTGNHCHFGIKRNGTFVNPLRYLR